MYPLRIVENQQTLLPHWSPQYSTNPQYLTEPQDSTTPQLLKKLHTLMIPCTGNLLSMDTRAIQSTE